METRTRPFSVTDPPDEDDIDGLLEWAAEITRRNREFVEQERSLHNATARED